MQHHDDPAERFRLGLGSKLVALLAIALSALFGGTSLFVFTAFDRLGTLQEQRVELLDGLNRELRAEVFSMQDRYLEIPKRLKVDPQGEIESWLAGRPRAEERRHSGREAIVARYRERSQRRDLQKPGRYVVEEGGGEESGGESGGGSALSYGLFDADGAFQDAVVEWRLPATAVAELAARVEQARGQADDPRALARKLAELEAELVDEALTAETTRNALLDQVERIGQAGEALAEADRILRLELLLVALGGLLLALLLLFLIVRRLVTRPLGRIAAAARGVSAEQPLELPETRRSDQIGEVARAVEGFQRALSENRELQTAQVRERAEMLATVERRLSEVAGSLNRQMQEGVETATQMSSDLAALAETLQSRIAQGNETAASAVRSAQDGAETTEDARRMTLTLRDGCLALANDLDEQRRLSRSVAEEAQQATTLVDSLSATAGEIGQVLELVDRIAGQINLLALNAMIEAQAAGKAGAGFSVVAAEVKDLSVQTSEANKRIVEQIDAIRQATSAATGTVARIEARVGDVDRSIAAVSDSFAELVSTTATIVERSEQSARLNHSLVAINESVSAEARQSNEMGRRMALRSEEISASVGRLREDLAAILAAAGRDAVA